MSDRAFLGSYELDGFAAIIGAFELEYVQQWEHLVEQCLQNEQMIKTGISIAQYCKSKPHRFALPGNIYPAQLGMYIVSNPGGMFPEVEFLMSRKQLWQIASAAMDVCIDSVAFSFLNFTRKPALYGPEIGFHRDYGNKLTCTVRADDMVRLIITGGGGIEILLAPNPALHRTPSATVRFNIGQEKR